jgi:hypothetical protein
MKYIEFVKVDAGDGLPETQFPLRNGPADPLPEIFIAWWATDADGVPHYFGAAPDDADTDVSGVIRMMDAQEWEYLVVARRKAAQDAIDNTAGVVRVQFVSAGQFIEQEYRLALEEVAAWRADGSNTDAAPDSVKSGAEYAGVTIEEAAVEIEQSAQAWTEALLQIRNLRLMGKRQIRECAPEAITSTMQSSIDQLQALPSLIQVPLE